MKNYRFYINGEFFGRYAFRGITTIRERFPEARIVRGTIYL
jgi:hypothetical protein